MGKNHLFVNFRIFGKAKLYRWIVKYLGIDNCLFAYSTCRDFIGSFNNRTAGDISPSTSHANAVANGVFPLAVGPSIVISLFISYSH